MKLILDIPDTVYEAYQEWGFIANAIPYEERPTGKWIREVDWVHCSACGHEQNYPSNYCPKCGTQMDMEGDVK